MPVILKSLLPFALLGTAGLVSLVATDGPHHADTRAPPAPPTMPATTANGLLRVEAAFEHGLLPAGTAGETFLRVSVTGLEQPQTSQRRPVGLTLVIDRSGSMGSEHKMQAANDAACRAIQALQPGDRFAVLTFDDGAELIARGDATPALVDGGCRSIHALSARGSTDMIAGLLEGGQVALQMAEPGRVSRLLLLSDGRPNGEGGLREQAAQLARQGVVTTTIGLGTNYNEDLMAGIADAGVGNSWFVESRPGHTGGTTLAQIFGTELSSMTTVVAKNAVIDLGNSSGLRVMEVVGFPFVDGGTDAPARRVAIGDVYAGHTTELLVRVAHQAHKPGVAATLPLTIEAVEAATQRDFRVIASASATWSGDEDARQASRVLAVAEKVEEFHTTQALLAANEAWNRGDQVGGDAILDAQKANVQQQAQMLGSTRLKALFSDVDSYQQQNAAVGASGRASMNKMAKEKARDYVRSAKKH